MTDIANKLREARALIERGWCQTAYRRGDCVCSLGAIGEAYTGDSIPYGGWVRGEVGRAVSLFAGQIGGSLPGHIADWNDAEGRTQAEVLAAFDKAIELAEAQS